MLPLAERLRPKTLNEYIGQKHLVGEGAVLRQMIENGSLSSFILWGPPGVGKTTLARIIAHQLERPFYTLSAVTSGVKEVREVIDMSAKDDMAKAKEKKLSPKQKQALREKLTAEMREAAQKLDFERAAYLRDTIAKIK